MFRKSFNPIVIYSLIMLAGCISTPNPLIEKKSDFFIYEAAIKGNNYILSSDSGGMLSLLFNSSNFIFEKSGLEFMYGNSTYTFADLSDIKIESDNEKITVNGTMGDFDTEFILGLYPDAGGVRIELDWNRPLSVEFSYCNFAIHLDSFSLKGQKYIANEKVGYYPENYSEMILKDGIYKFQLNNRKDSIVLNSGNSFKLADARVWQGEGYTLLFDLKKGREPVSLNIKLPFSDTVIKSGRDLYNLRYSLEGYSCNSEKAVFLEWPGYMQRPDDEIKVISSSGEIVLEGFFGKHFRKWQFNYAKFDFSSITVPGDYYLSWSGGESEIFTISNNIYDNLWRDALEVYIPWQMCHVSVDLGERAQSHNICHIDDGVRVLKDTTLVDGFHAYDWPDTQYQEGEHIQCNTGGWHDAGDYDLNTAAQSVTIHHLALAYEEFLIMSDTATLDLENKKYSADIPDGIPDILQQVLWGTFWLLSMQQEDGRIYPGIVSPGEIYHKHLSPDNMSDGINNSGDERNVYIDYQSSEHLKGVIALAAASRVLKDFFPDISALSLKSAEKGFEYYRRNGKTDHIQTSIIFDNLDPAGAVQTEIAAASELFITTGKLDYLNIVKKMESEIDLFQWKYNIPHNTFRMNNIYAAPFLARLYGLLDDRELKRVIYTYLESCIDRKDYLTDFENWPYETMINPWFGENHFPVRFVYDTYYISRVVPDKISVLDCQPLFYWLLGMHPLDSNVYITGLNQIQPDYLFSKQAVALYGEVPFSVPGAVIPGLCSIGGDIFFDDRTYSFECIEPVIDVSATLVFASFALSGAVKK